MDVAAPSACVPGIREHAAAAVTAPMVATVNRRFMCCPLVKRGVLGVVA